MKKAYLYILMSFLVVIGSCHREFEKDNSQNDFFVNENQARQMALHAPVFDSPDMKNHSTKITQRVIQEVNYIRDDQGVPTHYIFNFANQVGFMIIPADKREDPVLAMGYGRSFRLDSLPTAVTIWLDIAQRRIAYFRSSNEKPSVGVMQMWCEYAPTPAEPAPLPGDSGCDRWSFYEEKRSLLTTKWGQCDPYNNNVPLTGCAECLNNRAPAGCMAIAMGQIMYYHKYPATYNWTGTSDMPRLIKDIGDAVNMSYACGGSGTTRNGSDEFKSNFGYSSSVCYLRYEGTSNYEKVFDELRNNRPVLFGGYKKEYILGIPYRGDGHAWVCDGFRRWADLCYSGHLFHMNWGWGGLYDGYYGAFNPTSGRSYNYKSDVIIGIKP